MRHHRSFADTLTDLLAVVAIVILMAATIYLPLAGILPTVRRLLDGDLVEPTLAVGLAFMYLVSYTLGDHS